MCSNLISYFQDSPAKKRHSSSDDDTSDSSDSSQERSGKHQNEVKY